MSKFKAMINEDLNMAKIPNSVTLWEKEKMLTLHHTILTYYDNEENAF